MENSLNIRLLDENGAVRPLRQLKKEIYLKALEHLGWNFSEAASALGIGRSTLYRISSKQLGKGKQIKWREG